MSMVCIRCGSTTHTTRDHDEGKVGGAAGGNNSNSAASAAAKKKAAAEKKGSANSAGVKALYVHHDQCWARPSRNPGIPDVIEPPFRMQPYQDTCVAAWESRGECLCKNCEKKRKKQAFIESQKKKRIAERGKYG